jgi:phosphatidylinositol alpha-mannosyltransferase
MRVAMVCPYSMSRPGGVQGQVLGLSRELRRLDIDVRIVAPCDGPPPDPSIVSVGPTVEWESNGSIAPIAPGRATARRTAEALRSLEPDVVHLHEPPVPGPTLTSLIGFNGPMVGTFHASGEVPHQWLRPALRSLMMRLTFRVAVSESARETADANWSGAEYTVLWNGIEIERIASADPTPSPRPAVLFLGRHEPRKGLDVLLDAWEGVDRAADLWVIGAGPQHDELRARPVPDVEWLGSVTDVERNARLRGATLFCAPSLRGESFGVVLLEAMAASTPIVASAIEGYRNVARPDRDAMFVPPGDAVALRNALRRLIDDADLRARLVASGHERAEQFSMRRLAERYLELYERSLVRA